MFPDKIRCSWPGSNELMIQYHDEEWGVPVHKDRKLFEFMVLDLFQAGLSWQIILNKRGGFRSAFAEFCPEKVALFGKREIENLVNKTLINKRETEDDIPVSTAESDIMSKKLRKRRFKFIGTTICYAFMQVAGMLNDHLLSCFRHDDLG